MTHTHKLYIYTHSLIWVSHRIIEILNISCALSCSNLFNQLRFTGIHWSIAWLTIAGLAGLVQEGLKSANEALRISEESGDRRGQVGMMGMMGEILGENHATSQWFPPLKHAWQRITGNTQISLVYRSWWTLFFCLVYFWSTRHCLVYFSFFLTGAQSSQAAALVTIGEIYSMNGKKDEARKAPRVHRGVPWLSRSRPIWDHHGSPQRDDALIEVVISVFCLGMVPSGNLT